MTYILAIDQGTTSSRAILFDSALRPIASDQQEFPQHFPASGWVEHDPEDIWSTVIATIKGAIVRAGIGAKDIAALGITNQRETTVVWDKITGRAIHKAIVWQDRRTADTCAKLKALGHEPMVAERTGLLLDPYFSASKLGWILDQTDGARARAAKGDLLFGTIDSFLIWRLSGGKVHATDATNAARTMLFNIRTGDWDDDLLALFNIPRAMLPDVRDCADDYGFCDGALFGHAIAIRGVAGDQQAATMGQACFQPGMMKSTYGTGCFALLNTGATLVQSRARLLGTIAYRLGGKTTYALEGSIFIAGAVVQWLRDGLGIIQSAPETQALAERADPAQTVTLVPAFTGLGAPYWNADCRGAIFGLTRNSGPAEVARAALESVGFQTRDLIDAMRADWRSASDTALRVDGGMVASDYAMQFLSDIIAAPVDRPTITETTALGVAWLAGMQSGLCPDQTGFAANWALERRFTPKMPAAKRDTDYARWHRAVRATQMV